MIRMREFLREYKWFAAGGGMLFILLVCFLLFNNGGDEGIEMIENVSLETEVESEEVETEVDSLPDTVFIEVKGAVKNPGVYEIARDARVTNVLEMAQILPTADLNPINQSQKVFDEMVIYIPLEGEEIGAEFASDSHSKDVSDTININTAEVNDLTTLNGIGEKKAALIVEHRETNGLFMKKEDLMNISGIGEKTFESLESYITID